jgi:16S rRNA processing protein RimM
MNQQMYVTIGRVVKTHGLKGEVSVAPAAATSFSVLDGMAVWFVPPPEGVRESRVISSRRGPKGPLVTFEGVVDLTTAARLVGTEVLVLASTLPPEWHEITDEPDEFVGYVVTDDVHGHLGEITETIVTGANDVWVVEGPLGEVLIPVIDDCVVEVDDERETVRVKLLDGLLPEDGEPE